MAKVIACINQKGGVGKTTTSINLGAGLARKGKKVLLIDWDPQGSLTSCLGFPEPDEMEETISQIIEMIVNEEEFDLNYGILHQEEGMDVMPANVELAGLEVSLVSVMCRESMLRNYIQMIESKYDYIIIDCMASLGILTINALVAADSVLIPAKAEKMSIRGLQQLIKTIGKVRRSVNPKLSIEAMVINMVDIRTRYSKDTAQNLCEAYGEAIPIVKIPRSVRVEETPAECMSIYLHDPKGKATEAFELLVQEVLEHE